jgi:hypothetical protein
VGGSTGSGSRQEKNLMSRIKRLAHLLVWAAAELDKRVQFASQQFPQIPVEKIQAISQSDPVIRKYLIWTLKQITTRDVIWPEDSSKLLDLLTKYEKIKARPTEARLHQINPEIQKYTYTQLEDKIQEIFNIKFDQEQKLEQSLKTGSRLIYDQSPWKIIEIKDALAAVHYAQGTNWCTKALATAEEYLFSGPLYVIFKDGVKLAQINFAADQLMDVKDRDLCNRENLRKHPEINSLIDILQNLKILEDHSFVFLDYLANLPADQREQYSDRISRNFDAITEILDPMNPDLSDYSSIYGLLYNDTALKTILDQHSAKVSFHYNLFDRYLELILRGQSLSADWQKIVAGNPFRAFDYAMYCRSVRQQWWTLGDDAIRSNPQTRDAYIVQRQIWN